MAFRLVVVEAFAELVRVRLEQMQAQAEMQSRCGRDGSEGHAPRSTAGTPLDCIGGYGIASATRHPATLYECSFAYAAAAPQPYCATTSWSARAASAVRVCCFA